MHMEEFPVPYAFLGFLFLFSNVSINKTIELFLTQNYAMLI